MPQRPNILFILTDQQRWDTLGCYGNPWVRTPVLDRLAMAGIAFTHACCNAPISAPSRASLLTGRYPRTTRCRANGQDIPADEVPFTRLLADAGYRCGLIGKLHTSACHPSVCPGPERRIDDGLDVFEWSNSPGPTPDQTGHAYRDWLAARGGEQKEPKLIDCEWLDSGRPEHLHATTWNCERGMAFIDEAEALGQPWYLNISIFDPHHSFNPPNAYLQRYLHRLEDIPLPAYTAGELQNKPPYQHADHLGAYNDTCGFPFASMSDTDHRVIRAAYWAMCDLIDAQVGHVLDHLDAIGARDHTLVVFSSDHGDMLGDHGIYLKGPYFYDPLLRVPLLIQGPGVAVGHQSDALVELIDLAPTLLAAAGLKPHPGMQGQSLWPLLQGGSAADHRQQVYSEYLDAMPFHTDPPAWATMVRTRTHKLVVDHAHSTGELYDLVADPGEVFNRWDDPAALSVKANLLLRLNDSQARTVDPLPERQAPW